MRSFDPIELMGAAQALLDALNERAKIRKECLPSLTDATFLPMEDDAILVTVTLEYDVRWQFWLRPVSPGSRIRQSTFAQWWSESQQRWIAWEPEDVITRIGKL